MEPDDYMYNKVLRPCPFCKFQFSEGNSSAHKKKAKGSSTMHWWTVRCPLCRAYGPREHTEHEAKIKWGMK